jgi:hypothetical protein
MDMEGSPQNHPVRRAVLPRVPLNGRHSSVPTTLNPADRPAAAVSPIQRKDRWLEAILQAASAERRSKVRFPLELRVHFRTLGRFPVSGAGWVLNMSSGGVLVASRHDMKAGTPIELNIEWPYLLNERIPLQLVAAGRIVRSGTTDFAMVLAQHQFRTKTRAIIPMDVSRDEVCNSAAKKASGG